MGKLTKPPRPTYGYVLIHSNRHGTFPYSFRSDKLFDDHEWWEEGDYDDLSDDMKHIIDTLRIDYEGGSDYVEVVRTGTPPKVLFFN